LIHERLNLPASATISLYVGRLVPQKNVAEIIRAFRYVCDHSHDANLVIVGDGPLRTSLEEFTATLGLQNRVHFWGSTPDPKRLMREADLLVMRSLHEGFGLVVAEAAMQETSALVPRTPGLTEAAELCGGKIVDDTISGAYEAAWLGLLL